MRLRRFPVIKQRKEKRGLKAVRVYACSGTTVAFLLALLYLASRLVGQHRGTLITLREGSTAGANIISQKYSGLVNAYHTTVEAVSGAHSAAGNKTASEGATTKGSHVYINLTNPADEDRESEPAAVADVGSPGRSSTKTTATPGVKTEIKAPNQTDTAHPGTTDSVAAKPKHEKTLAEYLNFSEKTAINYMHFHKTGGVSFKSALFGFFMNKKKRNGEKVRLQDACYMRKLQVSGNVPTFDRWRCDWAPIWEMTETERNKLDVVFGHQYWKNGAEAFLNKRDMRTFTVLRHPFNRKVSFFFHFFVRERNRDENKVEFDEVRDFVLYDKIRDKSLELGQDLGPNYMAGRLLSDGFEGYVGDSFHKYYDVKPDKTLQVTEKALKIMRNYIFIGLQSESEASKCMLRKTVDVFNAAHGIVNSMTKEVARTAKVLNTGSYSLTASKIWARLSPEERILFERNERADLAIYEEGVRLFKQQVWQFQCGHLLEQK